jgi:hypothetical protein
VRIALITSVYGAYDPVRPVDPEWGFDDAVCVTDRTEGLPDSWRAVIEPTNAPPRLAAKHAKMTPWNYTDCDAALWVDASIEITSAHLRGFVEQHLERSPLVVWTHPEGRMDIRQEGPVCWDWPKYADQPMREQIDAYVADGYPERWGLFACGVLAWRFTPEARALGEAWLKEQYAWTIQDQISLPYLLWREGMTFDVFRAHQYQNPYFRIRWDERPAGQGPTALA